MKKALLYVVTLLLITSLSFFIYKQSLSEQVNLLLLDTISKKFDPKKAENHYATIVEIDEQSLHALGQWPWPRVVVAQLLNTINSYHPNGIAFDIIFAEEDKTSPKNLKKFYNDFFGLAMQTAGLPESLNDNDALLADALSRSHATLPTVLLNSSEKNQACAANKKMPNIKEKIPTIFSYPAGLCSIESLQQAASNSGFINAYLDSDGHYRRAPLLIEGSGSYYTILGLSAFGDVTKNIEITQKGGVFQALEFSLLNREFTTDTSGTFLLNFYDREEYQTISAVDLFLGKVEPSKITGKIVLIGATAIGLHDHYTITDGKQIPGIYMHATVIDNILNNQTKYEPDNAKMLSFLLSAFGLAVILIFAFRAKLGISIALFILLSLLYFALVLWLYTTSGLYISAGYFYTPFFAVFALVIAIYLIANFIKKKNFYKNLSIELEQKVHERTKELQESKERIEYLHEKTRESIEFASFIQKAIIPKEALFEKFFSDYFIIWKPRDIVGGDIYLCKEIDEDSLILLLVDCTGHGVPGAMVTMIIKSIEQQISLQLVNREIDLSPAKIMERFNREIKKLLNQYDRKSLSDVGFDGCVLYYNKKERVLKYASAKATLFVLKDGKMETLKGDKQSVGYVRSKDEFEYEDRSIDLEGVDSLYLLSDGLIDQKGGDSGFSFGKERLKETILQSIDSDLQTKKDIIVKMLEEYQGDFDQIDDITLIGLKP